MNSISTTRNTTATLAPKRSAKKRVVLAGRFAIMAKTADQLRKLGWEVHTVAADRDMHAVVAETDPHAILLSETAGTESGYLTCAKLLHTQPDLKVVVIGQERTEHSERFAEFVGAEFVTEADGVAGLVAAVS